MVIVPPGGFTGFAQMTPASRAALGAVTLRNSGGPLKKRRRRKSTRSATRTTKRRAKRSTGKRKLKFGSPAWRAKYNKKR